MCRLWLSGVACPAGCRCANKGHPSPAIINACRRRTGCRGPALACAPDSADLSDWYEDGWMDCLFGSLSGPHTAPQHLPESRTTYPGQQILLFFWPDPAHCHFWSAGYKPYRWKGTNFAIDLNAWLPSSTEFVNWFLLACFEFISILFFISEILEQLGVGSSSDSWGYPERERLVVRDLATLCLSLNLGTFGGLCDYLYKSLTK
jgi:hypothetical protein